MRRIDFYATAEECSRSVPIALVGIANPLIEMALGRSQPFEDRCCRIRCRLLPQCCIYLAEEIACPGIGRIEDQCPFERNPSISAALSFNIDPGSLYQRTDMIGSVRW